MRISVVIPAYNEEKYLPACLESLHKQTVMPYEIIVVDNNSHDQTAKVAASLRATVVSELQQGISYARNAGFSAATGDIIARCDADSILPADWLERIAAHFADSSVVAVSGPGQFYDAKSNLNGKPSLVAFWFFSLSRFVQGYHTLFGSNMALRRSAWLAVKDFVCTQNQRYHEDMDLAIHLHDVGAIQLDQNLIAGISARRMNTNPYSLLIDYPLRWAKTIFGAHRHTVGHAKD